MRRSCWLSVPGLALVGLLAGGAGSTPHAARRQPIHETAAQSRVCPNGGLPFAAAAAKVPVLNNLPDGGTVTFIGSGFHTWYLPCSWSLSFTADPPMNLLAKVLAVDPGGFGYSLGPQTPARPTQFVFSETLPGYFALKGQPPNPPLPNWGQ